MVWAAFSPSMWVTALGSSPDVVDVLDSAADLLPKHQLQFAQARRAVTSECATVFPALMNCDHREACHRILG